MWKLLINLSRGTGWASWNSEQNDKIIRPYFFSREEIAIYADENGIEWRKDSSNASDK
jgi:tRNA(Ile)-lysidine synthase